MRIGTYNVLGLTGYPAEESRKQIDRPGTADNVAHFTEMGVRFVMTSVGQTSTRSKPNWPRFGRAKSAAIRSVPSPSTENP